MQLYVRFFCPFSLTEPTSSRYMRPNTPHMVVTTDHNHLLWNPFVSSATIRQTCYSLFHMFIARSEGHQRRKPLHLDCPALIPWFFITKSIYMNLFMISTLTAATFQTSPHPKGVLDLFTFLVTVELSIILHPQTYQGQAIQHTLGSSTESQGAHLAYPSMVSHPLCHTTSWRTYQLVFLFTCPIVHVFCVVTWHTHERKG